MSLNTALMWRILGYRTVYQDREWRRGLFHPSFPGPSPMRSRQEDTTVDGPTYRDDSTNPHVANRMISESPAWFNQPTYPINQVVEQSPKIPGSRSQPQEVSGGSVAASNTPGPHMWNFDEMIDNNTLMDIRNDAFMQSFGLEGDDSNKWDFGIL